MILRDKYAGYRNYEDDNWEINESRPYMSSEWTDWDFALASVGQLIEDYTNKDNGQLYWIDSSDKVEWQVRSSYSGYDAAMDGESESLEPGESRYAVPVYDEDDPPTLTEWIESLGDENVHSFHKRVGHAEWEILNARDDVEDRRREMMEKLKSMQKPEN